MADCSKRKGKLGEQAVRAFHESWVVDGMKPRVWFEKHRVSTIALGEGKASEGPDGSTVTSG